MGFHYSDISKMKETINIKRGTDITPITYIDSGQIAEIKKHGNKFHEFTMLEAIAKMDLPRGTFLDIGAHVGNHSVFFAKYCDSCETVFCYEPTKETYITLIGNIPEEVDYKFRPINRPVSDEVCWYSLIENTERPGQNKTVKGGFSGSFTSIDFEHYADKIVLMKIDVEGGEIDVLKGAKETIAKHLPELFIEHHADPNELLPHLPKKYKIIKRYNNAPTYHLSAR